MCIIQTQYCLEQFIFYLLFLIGCTETWVQLDEVHQGQMTEGREATENGEYSRNPLQH